VEIIRTLKSFIKKYGPVVGPQLLKKLQQRSSASSRSLQDLKKFKKLHGI